MKKLILLFVSQCMIVSTWAYDFSVNGIFYKIKTPASTNRVAVTAGSATGNSYSGDVVIPSSVTNNAKTYSVTEVDAWAFASSYDLTSITIPTSVDTISDGAFWGCIKMPTLAIPASVKKIGSYVFYGCDKLTNIAVDEANVKYKSDQGLLYNKDKSTLLIYPAGKSELSYTISSSVDTIGDMAFGHCENLKSITIPTSVVYITGHAFTQCNALTSMFIPASVTFLNNNPFYDCKGMTSVTVDPANQYNESVDGVLFKKGLTTIIYYPPAHSGSSYVIPSTVTYVRSSVFMNCTSLTSVTIPASVQTIRSGMFSGCTGLTSINAYSSIPIDLTNTVPGNNSDKVFEGVDTLHCVLHVPVGSKSLYAGAYQWKGFSNIVEGFASAVSLPNTSKLNVGVQNGQLQVIGALVGENITVYTLQGITLYSQKATAEAFVLNSLPMHGVYVVRVGKENVKVVY